MVRVLSNHCPQLDIDALVLDNSKTASKLNVPTASGVNKIDIVFQATMPTASTTLIAVPSAPITARASSINIVVAISTAIAAGGSSTITATPTTMPASIQKRQPLGAQLTQWAVATGGNLNLILLGTNPCTLNPWTSRVLGPSATGGIPGRCASKQKWESSPRC